MRATSLLLLLACDPTKPTGAAADDSAADTDAEDRYHPDGFASSSVHGIAAKYQQESCVDCHGSDLTGGTAEVSCDACHPSGWRTDCTFCHGGSADATGAPPEDIDDQESDLAFPGHTAHVTATDHTAWGCEQCHVVPGDVLSSGHFLVDDQTPGVAEVELSGGLSPDGQYSAGCDNLYCHGDGRSPSGTIAVDDTVACGDCHAGPDSGNWGAMSGEHSRHMNDGVACSDCHAATVSEAGVVEGLELHVDGAVDYALPEGISVISGTCNGICHDEIHLIRSWE